VYDYYLRHRQIVVPVIVKGAKDLLREVREFVLVLGELCEVVILAAQVDILAAAFRLGVRTQRDELATGLVGGELEQLWCIG
jgi:hypothetical protein